MPSKTTRRKLIQSLSVSMSAAVASVAVPDKWIKPVVDVVTLPAHANTTNKKSKKSKVPPG